MDGARRRLCETLGHAWRDESLLAAALLHRSAAVERGMGDWAESQRLEFLGDAVLDLLAADWLMRRLPGVREGRLTALRSRVTCTGAFAEVARGLELGAMVELGVGEEKCGGRDRESLLADTLEAVFGALWTDGGWAAVEKAFGRVFGAVMEAAAASAEGEGGTSAGGIANPKGALQEWAQARGAGTPEYAVTLETGPAHARQYAVEVRVGDRAAPGTGGSKHAAEEAAARAWLAAFADS